MRSKMKKLASRRHIIASSRIQGQPVEMFNRGDKVGNGVRATRPLKRNEIVAVYYGKLKYDPNDTRFLDYSYVLDIGGGWGINGKPTSKNRITGVFLGSVVNDGRGLRKKNNVRYSFGRVCNKTVVWIKTTKFIKKGSELFASYGNGYWRS